MLPYKVNKIHNNSKNVIVHTISTIPITVINTNTEKIVLVNKKLILHTQNDFLTKLGFTESGNNYKRVNTLGYLGKYQFGKSTLRTLRYKGSTTYFLNSPKLQEKLMLKLLRYNKRRLRRYIKKYNGLVINNTVITESGILAAAHLAGQGNVKRFFRNGKNPKDKYGTPLTKYLTKFSGYSLEL